MSTSTPAAPEQLPANIPRLEPDGSNWAIFLMRFRMAMQATNRWDYFDGSKPRPVAKDTSAPTDEEKESAKCWEHDDLIARYLLSQCLPDSTVLRLNQYTMAQTCWAHVSDEYTAKSVYAQNDLEQAFFEMRCPSLPHQRAQ